MRRCSGEIWPGRLGNVAHLGLGWLSENVTEVREVLAGLWLGRCWLWCSGELERARWSKAAGNGVGTVLLLEAKERAGSEMSERGVTSERWRTSW